MYATHSIVELMYSEKFSKRKNICGSDIFWNFVVKFCIHQLLLVTLQKYSSMHYLSMTLYVYLSVCLTMVCDNIVRLYSTLLYLSVTRCYISYNKQVSAAPELSSDTSPLSPAMTDNHSLAPMYYLIPVNKFGENLPNVGPLENTGGVAPPTS